MKDKNKTTTRNSENIDFAVNYKNNGGVDRLGPLLPDSIRCIIAGICNSGETNIMFNLLFDINGLRFTNNCVLKITVSTQMLESMMKSLIDEGIGYQAYSENEEIQSPEEIGSANSI